MEKIGLKTKNRDITGRKVSAYRKQGLIPAILYGKKVSPKNLWVDSLDFDKVFSQAGESTILELDIDGRNKANVLIHDVQNNPVSGDVSHIDFFQIRMDQRIETEVPLDFIGESEAVKSLGGVLVKSMGQVPVSCLPADLPARIEVDISLLNTFDNTVKISDLKVSDKVKILIEPETVIANVAPPRTEEELAELEEKVEEDVTKVEGVEKEEPEEESVEEKGELKEEAKIEEKAEGKTEKKE